MSQFTIQEQFNHYVSLLNKIHNIDQDIDALINEVEITDMQNKRALSKKSLKQVNSELIASLSAMGNKYPIHNYLAGQTTYLFVENGKLRFEYH